MYNIFELNEKSLEDLKLIATEMGIDDENRDRMQLIYDIIDHQVDHPDIKKNDGKANKKKKKSQNANKPEPSEPALIEQPKEPMESDPVDSEQIIKVKNTQPSATSVHAL